MTCFKVGDRVAACAPSFGKKGAPNYGAFQEKVLIPANSVSAIPASMSFTDASMLPMAVRTSWQSLYNLGVPNHAKYAETDKQGILIWSAASAMGATSIQIARSLGFHVYATASKRHHEYLASLGRGPGKITLFDYSDKDVVAQIVCAGKADRVVVDKAILCSGSHTPCIRVLDGLKGGKGVLAKVSSMPFSLSMLWWRIFPRWGGTSLTFCGPANNAENEAMLTFVFNEWLGPNLVDGSVVPAPHPRVIHGGVEKIGAALDALKAGVSGEKLIVEM